MSSGCNETLFLITKNPIRAHSGKLPLQSGRSFQDLLIYSLRNAGRRPDLLRVGARNFYRCCETYYLDISEKGLVGRFFDYISESYGSIASKGRNVENYEWTFDAVLRYGKNCGTIVDLGAGHGFGIEVYEKIPHGKFQLIATDVSLGMLVRCPKQSEKVAGAAENLPFRSLSLCGIVAVYLLHYIYNPGRFFEEMSRTLAPDGILAFVVYRHDPHKYQYRKMLEDSGFKIIESVKRGHSPSEERIVAAKTKEVSK